MCVGYPVSALKDFFKRLSKHFSSSNGQATHPPTVNLAAEIDAIRRIEQAEEIDLGKRIHCFRHQGLELRLDRDVLGWYRVTVSEGKDRRYSFTIVCEPGDYDTLRAGYEEITAFLDGNRHLTDLPRHDRLKGHYYGS
jgi:hypothetical protein